MRFGTKLTPGLMPCIIKDAKGREIENVVEGDTLTGRCWVILTGVTGMPIKGRKGGRVEAEKQYDPPLTIEPLSISSSECLRELTKQEEAMRKAGMLPRLVEVPGDGSQITIVDPADLKETLKGARAVPEGFPEIQFKENLK